MWVKIKNMKIDIADMDFEPDDEDAVKFYEGPSLNSDVIFRSGKFLATDLLEIKDLWTKVSFSVDGKVVVGWLHQYDQCPYPWTTCP